jgi:hypothetical protein
MFKLRKQHGVQLNFSCGHLKKKPSVKRWLFTFKKNPANYFFQNFKKKFGKLVSLPQLCASSL